jgi:hypothetical protein
MWIRNITCYLMWMRNSTCYLMWMRNITWYLMWMRNITCYLMWMRNITCNLMWIRNITCCFMGIWKMICGFMWTLNMICHVAGVWMTRWQFKMLYRYFLGGNDTSHEILSRDSRCCGRGSKRVPAGFWAGSVTTCADLLVAKCYRNSV